MIQNRENLSTEELIQLASTLADGEYLQCFVNITPIIRLVVYLDKNAQDTGFMGTCLEVWNRAQMRRPLRFSTYHHSIQTACIGGRHMADSTALGVWDIINIFELGPLVTWTAYMVVREPSTNQGYTIETRQADDDQFEATVQEISVTVTGTTDHDALNEAVLAIHLNMMEEYKKQKAEEERSSNGH